MRRIAKFAAFATAVAAIAITIAPPAAAQRVTGQLAGTVKDESGAVLPGVTVTLNGEKIMGSQTAVTTASGYYRFLALPPGVYSLTFELGDFAPQTRNEIRVNLGGTTVENVQLSLGGVAEAIVVIGEAPVIDTESNEVGVNYGRDWVENAPVQRQSFNDLVAAAPGSLQGQSTGAGVRRTMVYGSSYDENSFQLDGADVNDNFFNEQLAELNVDTIEEIEVLSLGAPAEYGNVTGAVYNIVTRQGSNDFHGDVNFFTQPSGLTEENTDDDEDDGFPFERDKFNDYTVQLGGPLSRDKAWFFVSFQHQEDSSSDVGVDPAIGTELDEFDRFFGKLNFQLNPSHKIQVTFSQDERAQEAAPGVGTSPSTATAQTGKTPTPGVGYTGVLTDTDLLDVRFTGFYGEVFEGPRDPGQPPNLPRFYDVDTGFISGGHYYFYDLEPERTTVNAKLSHLADDFVGSGSHDFRFGVQYNESSAGGLYGYNDFIYIYSESAPTYGYGFTRIPFSYSGNTEALGVFVDDTWRVNERLTLNLGVRLDENKAFSEAQEELDENGQPTGLIFPEFEHYTWEYVSPRFGFNYQLTDDGRTILKGHIGRYHRAIATGEFANVIGPSIKPIFAGVYDVPSGEFSDLFQITDNSNLSIDPNFDSPRVDQVTLSLERQIGRNTGLTVNLVKKEGSDFGAWQDVGGVYDTVQFEDPDTGSLVTLNRLLNDPSDLSFVITNRSEMDTDIEAASVNLVRRMANNWSLTASATYLKSEGRTPDSLGTSDFQQRGGLQFRTFGRNPNDFVNSGGRLRGDVPLQLKAQFVRLLPKDFTVSANVYHRDGANLVRRIRVPSSLVGRGSRILLEERGSSGRLPSATFFDARVEKNFAVSDDVNVGIFADVFNLFNEDAHEGEVSSDVNSSAFRTPDQFVKPRRVQLGARLRF